MQKKTLITDPYNQNIDKKGTSPETDIICLDYSSPIEINQLNLRFVDHRNGWDWSLQSKKLYKC